MNRLTERDEYGNADIIGVDSMDLQANLALDEFNRVTEALNRLAYYEDLEEQGRLVETPVTVGDTVWFLRPLEIKKHIEETEVEKIVVRGKGLYLKLACNAMYETSCKSIGKTVFLTRAEAEAALAASGKKGE